MPVKLFILGRPRSGKSHAAMHIASYLNERKSSSIHLNDYPFLLDRYREDEGKQPRQFHSDGYGGFVIDDERVLDNALQHIKGEVAKHLNKGLHDVLMIEFARPDYEIALQVFSQEFLQDTYFLFINTDIEICIERQKKQREYQEFHDDHHVSEEVMGRFYTKDNRLYMMVGLANDYQLDNKQVRIVNNMGTIEEFESEITHFLNFLIAREKEIRRLRETDPVQIAIPSVACDCDVPNK